MPPLLFYLTKSNKMKINLTVLVTSLFCVVNFCVLSQDSTANQTNKNNAYVFKLIPTVKDNVYGLAIGLVGSETVCNHKNTKRSFGINIQIIGQGLFIPMNPKVFNYKNVLKYDTSWMVQKTDTITFRSAHSGLLISTFGTMTDVSNGLIFSCLSSVGYKMNGFSFNFLSNKYTEVNGLSFGLNNESYKVRGIQLGVLNRTKHLKGIQIGFWNVNNKRSLPIINWSFK